MSDERLAAIEALLRKIDGRLDQLTGAVREHEISLGTLLVMARMSEHLGEAEAVEMPPEIEALLRGKRR